MESKGFHHKLATIRGVDVSGHSRLMPDDERKNVKNLESTTGHSDLIQQHRVKLVGSPGDNLSAEFASVVVEVQCAVVVQKELYDAIWPWRRTGGSIFGSVSIYAGEAA
jgi:adenylate cyclase